MSDKLKISQEWFGNSIEIMPISYAGNGSRVEVLEKTVEKLVAALKELAPSPLEKRTCWHQKDWYFYISLIKEAQEILDD